MIYVGKTDVLGIYKVSESKSSTSHLSSFVSTPKSISILL